MTRHDRSRAEAMWNEGRTVGDIAAALGASPENVSKHLIPLTFAGIFDMTGNSRQRCGGDQLGE